MVHDSLFSLGTQAAIAVAELHNFDREGQASVAHTDITPAQFVKVGSRYKLQDFNRARFLLWNATSGAACPYNVSSNPGKNRSPEEYAYQPQTEKVSPSHGCVSDCEIVLVVVVVGPDSFLPRLPIPLGGFVFLGKFVLHVVANGMALQR